MPTCRDMSELVTDYMERSVSRRLRLEMWWHLVRCDACRRYFDQVRRTVRLIATMPKQPDNEAADRVVAAARDEQR
jgi:predicted anti-sigma-YlaC factor YlaD